MTDRNLFIAGLVACLGLVAPGCATHPPQPAVVDSRAAETIRQATITRPDGSRFEGTVRGQQLIEGTMTYPDGKIEQGNFFNGRTVLKSPINQLDTIKLWQDGRLVKTTSEFDQYLESGDFDRAFDIRGTRSFLGINYSFGDKQRVEVHGVTLHGPAFVRGIRAGDAIVRANGESISDANQFLRQVMNTAYGHPLGLSIERDGVVSDVVVYPSIRPSDYQPGADQVEQSSFDEMVGYYRQLNAEGADQRMLDAGVAASLLDQYRSRQQQRLAQRKLEEACKANEQTWFYQGPGCRDGMAHGRGVAVSLTRELRFEGEFANGDRINGLISKDGVELYDGPIKGGRPDGEGICFHDGEPEKCEYYRGKRVDVLFKQRIEMARQQQAIDQKLQRLEQAQNARINQLQNQMQQSQVPATSLTGGMGNALIEAGQKRIADKIFDQLF